MCRTDSCQMQSNTQTQHYDLCLGGSICLKWTFTTGNIIISLLLEKKSTNGRESVCCSCKFVCAFWGGRLRFLLAQWTNLMNNISESLKLGRYSMIGSTLTRLEAPFPLVFKGSSAAETLLRLFDCSMNQQDALTVHTGPLFHRRILTKEQHTEHKQRLCPVCAEWP